MARIVIIIIILSLLGCAPELSTTATSTPAPTAIPTLRRAQIIASDFVYVRAAADKGSKVLDILPNGKTITVDYVTGNWVHLATGGYVFRGCVSGYNAGLGCK